MLIVNPNNRIPTDLAAIEPPLWAGLIASYLNADILDAEALDLTLVQTEERIRESGHRDILIVVMGNNPSVSSTPKMPVAEALASRIDDLSISITGLHPIAVNYNKYQVVSKPFEGFPMMPWDKLPMNKYRAHNWHCLDGSSRSPYASIYTSFGCPFDCYYCPIHTLYGNRTVQFREVKDVIKEIDILVTRYNVRNIKVWDELFALTEDRVLSICSGLKDYDLNIWVYARLDTITPNMLKAMKGAGINWVGYGFESITDAKFKDAERVIKITRDAGINIMANFMFGYTTLEDDKRSLEFAKKHLFEFVNFSVARPYPGSEWYKGADSNLTWEEYSQYGSNRMLFRDEAFYDYFTNPSYLEMITMKFGERGKSLIDEMLQWRVK